MRSFVLAGALALGLLPILGAPTLAANLVAKIDISTQTMVVSHNGAVKYRWKVSTGRSGYGTPSGSWSAKWLSKNHRSRKYNNAPMPYAVFFNGGYAVHGTNDLKRLGRPASHGCVRLDPRNAAVFFSMVQKTGNANTRIVISR
ncbi:L,D-transpeptidase-like protein [Hoeflea marina]|uniref:L,D-transpeptidase-like protein n=1 Tax=Hoeflea marina TaxID=274592 RepID=A0A317PHA2_9HYPH|nr:L,D-transpeptidase [Hoeflea marina]PWV98962.1 L,D-transpeptidase-like protein [Hoeflea marina]